jgi:hypothetical protein
MCSGDKTNEHTRLYARRLANGIVNNEKKVRGFGPLANYADRATAASWRSTTNFCG